MVSGVWNDFGLQMDLDPPLEGDFKRLKKKIIFLLGFIFKIYFLDFTTKKRETERAI